MADGTGDAEHASVHPLHASGRRRRLALRASHESVRHGKPEVLARLERGDEGTQVSTRSRRDANQKASRDLDWLNKGVFISDGARRAGRR